MGTMFGDLTAIATFFLAAVCAGGVAYALFQPRMAREAKTEKRLQTLSARQGVTRPVRASDSHTRRSRVQEALKEIEEKNKNKARRLTLRARMAQAGLSWSMRKYMLISLGFALAGFLLALILGAGLLVAAGLAFAAGIGLPRWLVNFLRTRRQNAFLNGFADAVDVIVRGVKSGLPLNDCIRIVAHESAEPVRGEFRQVVESQAVGMSTPDALMRMFDRMPLAEVNFLCIVVAIQNKGGGNLSETLANLSRVLRDRKKMRAKVQSMSMEAKASASIIGALPIAVMGLVYMTTPDYIELLWIDPLGNVMLAMCAGWMLCGVLVMRKMINFDF